jgi:hypothetical protein
MFLFRRMRFTLLLNNFWYTTRLLMNIEGQSVPRCHVVIQLLEWRCPLSGTVVTCWFVVSLSFCCVLGLKGRGGGSSNLMSRVVPLAGRWR